MNCSLSHLWHSSCVFTVYELHKKLKKQHVKIPQLLRSQITRNSMQMSNNRMPAQISQNPILAGWRHLLSNRETKIRTRFRRKPNERFPQAQPFLSLFNISRIKITDAVCSDRQGISCVTGGFGCPAAGLMKKILSQLWSRGISGAVGRFIPCKRNQSGADRRIPSSGFTVKPDEGRQELPHTCWRAELTGWAGKDSGWWTYVEEKIEFSKLEQIRKTPW